MKKLNRRKITNLSILISSLFLVCANTIFFFKDDITIFAHVKSSKNSYSIESIPSYNSSSYVVLENNKPNFTKEDYERKTEEYSELDLLGRCGVAFAKVGIETMPTEKRESIGNVKPSGWHTVKYDNINGKYLYNRCHLIGYQLTGENANPKNLITCTRHMNTKGMLIFEIES